MKKTLFSIGEYKVHDLINSFLREKSGEIKWFCEDSTEIRVELPIGENVVLISIDRGARVGLNELGARLCVTQAFSDIICSGGDPTGFLFGVFVPRSTLISTFEQVFQAAYEEVRKYDAEILGGDTKEDSQPRLVGVSIGTAKKAERLTLRGAKAGDLVAITKRKGNKIGLRWAHVVIERLKPNVAREIREACSNAFYNLGLPYREMQAARKVKGISSCTDLSDGIGGSLVKHSKVNLVGFALDADLLKGVLDPLVVGIADQIGIDMIKFALSPGYDWENLLTLDKNEFSNVRDSIRNAGGDLYEIGSVTDSVGEFKILVNGHWKRLEPFSDENFSELRWEDKIVQWVRHNHY